MVDLSRERERQKLEKKAAMGDFAAQEKLWQMMQEDMQHPPVEVDPAIIEEQRNQKTNNNDGLLDKLKDVVLDTVKKDPVKAGNKPYDVAMETIYKIKTGKVNLSPVLEDDSVVDFVLPDEPTVTIGDTGPIIKKEGAKWIQEGGDTVVKIVEDTSDNLKKYLPVALIGGAALLLIYALK